MIKFKTILILAGISLAGYGVLVATGKSEELQQVVSGKGVPFDLSSFLSSIFESYRGLQTQATGKTQEIILNIMQPIQETISNAQTFIQPTQAITQAISNVTSNVSGLPIGTRLGTYGTGMFVTTSGVVPPPTPQESFQMLVTGERKGEIYNPLTQTWVKVG